MNLLSGLSANAKDRAEDLRNRFEKHHMSCPWLDIRRDRAASKKSTWEPRTWLRAVCLPSSRIRREPAGRTCSLLTVEAAKWFV